MPPVDPNSLVTRAMNDLLDDFSGDNPENIKLRALIYTMFTLFAPLSSPPFTGNATGTTQTLSDNSTRFATTNYVWLKTKGKTQVTALSAIATADATDLATAIALVNVLKAQYNLLLAALKV